LILYGGFVWARRAVNSQKRRFPARAVSSASQNSKMKASNDKLSGKKKLKGAVRTGLGRIAALHHRPTTSYQIR
jgi:hypothetical protein